MPWSEVAIDLKARDQMSSVLDHVTQRLGVFNKAGIGMGIAFAGINIAVGALQQAFSAVVQYIQDGVEANRRFEMSLARLSVSSSEFSGSMDEVKSTLRNFSVMFATDISTLTDGLRAFISQGYSAAESVTMLWNAQRFAIVAGEDLATTTDTLDRIFNAFGLGVDDVSSVTTKLNDIMSITGMTLGEIDVILGRVAISAQESGISFNDLIDLMYTLHETGTSNRFMASELVKDLENLSKVKIDPMPDTTASSIDEKFKKISGTVQFTTDMMKQLGTISQMDLTGGLDLDAMFSKEKIDRAKEYFNTLNTQGISTLEDFNSVSGQLAAKELNPDFKYIGIEKQLWQLMRTMYQYNDMVDASAGVTETWQDKLLRIRGNLDDLNSTLASQKALLAQYAQAISDLTEMRTFTIDSHNATVAIQAQQAAIEKLQRVSDAYSLSQMKNSLEILKIQYGADTRHGLDRTQTEKIKELERANAGLQIKEMENQIAISQIQQTGLRAAQDRLDAIRKSHDDAMYGQQIRDLDANIKAQNELWSAQVTAIAKTNADIAKQQAEWWSSQLAGVSRWAKKMHDQMVYAYSLSGKQPSSEETETPKKPPRWIPRWKFQQGGLVQETAAALVHKGEFIIPKDMVDMFLKMPKEMPHIRIPEMRGPNILTNNERTGQTMNSSSNVNVNVNVNAELHKDVDVEEWGKRLGAGLASGFLSSSSSGTTTQVPRVGRVKNPDGTTSTSMVVQGSNIASLRAGRQKNPSGTIVTTLPLPQTIQSKGRFRRG